MLCFSQLIFWKDNFYGSWQSIS